MGVLNRGSLSALSFGPYLTMTYGSLFPVDTSMAVETEGQGDGAGGLGGVGGGVCED